MKNMTLKKKLIAILLTVGLLPFIIMGISSYISGSGAVSNEAYEKLSAVRDIKLKQYQQLFKFRKADLKVLAASTDAIDFIDNLQKIDDKIGVVSTRDYPVNHPLVKKVTKKYDSYFKHFMETYGYYDVFLIDAEDGHVVYTAARESDYGANLTYGKLRDSGLGKAFKMAKDSQRASLVDMAPYGPSNNEPAIFMAMPIFSNGNMTSILAIQISDKMITGIAQSRSGMGETGEVYLVGPDNLMRTDSFLDPVNHSLKASFANPAKGKVDTDAANEALAGKTDTKIIIDYNGNPVLSAYTILDLSKEFNVDFKWALLTEIDESEVFAPIDTLRNVTLTMGGVFFVLILLGAIYMGNNISNPIISAVEVLSEANAQIVSASDQIALSSTSLADGASQQASSVEEVSATIEQTTSINDQNSENAREADILAKDANESAAKGNVQVQTLMTSMENITSSSEQIAKIIKTIDEIAFQTNLLALNAAVEAARAGEHGLGFAVVAEEVKNLAGRSAKAAKETAEIIEGSINQVKQGNEIAGRTNDAFSDIVIKIKKTSDLIGEIAISAKEQSEGMRQVSASMGQIDDITQQNAAVSEEAAAAAEELNAQANSMLDSVNDVSRIVGVDSSANEAHHVSAPKERPKQRIEHRPTPVKTTNKKVSNKGNNEDVFPLDDEDLLEF